ncbi:MAG: AmmeMemoRadiSam system protein B [bacterium]
MSTRQAVVAGQFYPKDKKGLTTLLAKLLADGPAIKTKSLAVVAPHAGYVYSGKTAGKVYSSIEIPDTVIIMSPNHTGIGSPVSLDPAEKWSTPLGDVNADINILKKIKDKFSQAEFNSNAQTREHALEVHLPFLQILRPDVKIVPMTLADMNINSIKELGIVLAEIIIDVENKTGSIPLIVASSDMTHFEDAETAKKKDMMAIDKIKQLDTDGFIDVVENHDITLCGLYTIPVMMEAVKRYSKLKKLSFKVELIDYTNSGFVTGDSLEVVAYAGIVVFL